MYQQSPQNPPRGLEVAFTSWSGRHMKVTEDTSDGPLVYAADLKMRKPHMLFQATGTAQLPASVTFHNFSRTIDLSINGEEMQMKPTSKLKFEFEFHSHALPGKKLTWLKSKEWLWLNLDCVDESGTLFAQFKGHKSWTGKKSGRLQIYQPAEQALTDELVVTALADVYLQLMSGLSASSAAGASAGVSAAVSV